MADTSTSVENRPADPEAAVAFPTLNLLAASTDPLVPPAVKAREQCLNDPHLRQVLLDHLQMRNAIRRELEVCRMNHDVVPPNLERVLREFVSAASAVPLPTSDTGFPDDTAGGVGATHYAFNLSGVSTVGASTTHHTAASPLDTSATAFERDVIREKERPTTKMVLGAEYKASVQAAHAARTAGNRREEVLHLNDLLSRLKAAPVPDSHAACRVLRQLGDAHLALGEYATAESQYFDWTLVAEKQGDGREVARAMTAIGNTRERSGDLDRALEWYDKAALRMRTT